jgi:predicted  nucleic acid-binding Zn-ribbon protein
VSTAARKGTENFPAEWARLDRATHEAVSLLGRLVQRAREAEAEVERLRQSLEALAGERSASSGDTVQEVRRLRAENAALHSRMLQARKRISALMQRLAALDVEP